MKTIAIGMNLQSGPYGGGNQFGHALVQALQRNNFRVVFDLTSPHIDLILVTETRPWLNICAFDMRSALRYKAQHHIPVVLRVNECDERKNKRWRLLNSVLRTAAQLSTQTVFISDWLRKLIMNDTTALTTTSSVILNGADQAVFNSNGYQRWDGTSPLKIVTHHWSSNRLKGWDVYEQLDQLVADSAGRLAFTYIGNPPVKHRLRHTTLHAPLTGMALAAALKQHHVYITASINEPAGMHHIEAALCGLPLLYRQSGALPEYCRGFGVGFTGTADFPAALQTIQHNYHHYQPHMHTYANSDARMTKAYVKLFSALLASDKQTPKQSVTWAGKTTLAARLATLRFADHLQ
ncbi:MAG TPA: hypothetical protein VJC05_00435 [Candidatus Andersenbacteria bacterium]|nr:MAG: hypothetical protein A2854_04635 [Parcubacteria group bacterium RIFCSPHIGHO2_01_FULL_56_18]HLD25495.1 hypothetical protein [Candidatus Andersenbacteria bacterium]